MSALTRLNNNGLPLTSVTATKVHLNCPKQYLDNGLFIDHWRIVDTKSYVLLQTVTKRWSLPRVFGLCFCLVSELTIKVLYPRKRKKTGIVLNPLLHKAAATSLQRNPFLCPQGDRCGCTSTAPEALFVERPFLEAPGLVLKSLSRRFHPKILDCNLYFSYLSIHIPRPRFCKI